MTPCEALGYEVGDEFIALPGNGYFKEGEKVWLSNDDDTSQPEFRSLRESWYLNLEDVTPATKDSEIGSGTVPLADRLEKALTQLEESRLEVERLQSEFKEAYPLINREAQPTADMNDPANWKEGDVVECTDSEGTGEPDYFTEGKRYQLSKKDGSTSYKYVDDEGDDMWAHNKAFRFVSRPKK